MNAEVTEEVNDYLHDQGQYGDQFAQTVQKENQLEKHL
jgi:hypothetical protein